jgi:hypothetical protein
MIQMVERIGMCPSPQNRGVIGDRLAKLNMNSEKQSAELHIPSADTILCF